MHLVEVINKLARVRRELLAVLGREPTPEELGHELDLSPERVLDLQRYGRAPISLHISLGDEAGSELGDLIEDAEAVAPDDVVTSMALAEQDTRERIRQVERKALSKLRHPTRQTGLKDFL